MPWFLLGLMLFISGCASPHLRVEADNEIGIVSGHGPMMFTVKKELSDSVMLDGVLVKRSLYVTEASQVLVYEHARTLPPYAFQYDLVRSLRIIFESSSVQQLTRVGNLGLYAVALKDGMRLYAIAENENKNGIGIVYGLSRGQIEKIATDLGSATPHGIAATGEGIALPRSPAAFLSRWSPKMIILDGLLRRTGGAPYLKSGTP